MIDYLTNNSLESQPITLCVLGIFVCGLIPPLLLMNLAELWRYRDLLTILIWRDISANYRQSVIGYGWALFKPVLTMPH